MCVTWVDLHNSFSHLYFYIVFFFFLLPLFFQMDCVQLWCTCRCYFSVVTAVAAYARQSFLLLTISTQTPLLFPSLLFASSITVECVCVIHRRVILFPTTSHLLLFD